MTIVALAAGVFSNESTNFSAASYVSNDLFYYLRTIAQLHVSLKRSFHDHTKLV